MARNCHFHHGTKDVSSNEPQPEIIALFAEAVQLRTAPVPDEKALELQALVQRRGQLVQILSSEKARRQLAPQRIRKDIDERLREIVLGRAK